MTREKCSFRQVSAEECALCRWAPKSVCPRLAFVANTSLVESQALAINFEEFRLRVPVLTLAAHAFAKDARIQFASTRVTNAIENAIGFGRQVFAQTLFEIRSDAARQAQHVDE